jgi:multidrug efflux system membrane fusion protein
MRNSFAIASMVLLLAACSEAPPPPAAPRLVRTLVVGAGDTASEGGMRSYSGEVRARIETTLGFRIAGKIVERRVDVGQAVKAGQVLARLDPADSALQLAQAEAQHALAAADLARYRDLRTKNFVSASALDARETDLQGRRGPGPIGEEPGRLHDAGGRPQWRGRPGAGRAGQVVGAGQAVFRLAPDGEREVAIAIPESEIGAFKPGQAADRPFLGNGRRGGQAAWPAACAKCRRWPIR